MSFSHVSLFPFGQRPVEGHMALLGCIKRAGSNFYEIFCRSSLQKFFTEVLCRKTYGKFLQDFLGKSRELLNNRKELNCPNRYPYHDPTLH
jgi:hypothetical protein